MRIALLSFAFGLGLVQWLAGLPEWPVLAGIAAAGLVSVAVAVLLRQSGGRVSDDPRPCLRSNTHPHAREAEGGGEPWPKSRNGAARRRVALSIAALGIAALGFGYAAARGQLRLADHLPEQNEGRDIAVVGVVSGLPQDFERGQRFDFDVEWSDVQVPRRISLAWYRAPQALAPEGGDEAGEAGSPPSRAVRAGERWRLTLRLKRPHGSLNPHGFDYEGWLFERGVRATGYVRPRPEPQRLDAFVLRPGTLVERLRERIRERFRAALPDRDYAGVLVALAVGDQRAIESVQWQLFARTGTTHLMSISGLHVTMIAGLLYALTAALWRRVPALALRLPAQQAGIAAGWLGAFAYTLLSGFGVPSQRTLYMLSVVALALWLRRTTAPGRVLLLALTVVLLIDPWAVMAPGFWLSFGAVALLFFVAAGDILHRHWLRAWLRAQWAVTLGLVPALLALFQQFSLVSPLANAVAIPVVSLVVTPMALLAALLPLAPLLQAAHGIVAVLMVFLDGLGSLPAAVWQQAAPAPWAVALALVGCAWLLLPAAFPSRWAGAVLLLPLLATPPPRPAPGELRLTVLDVGQGLAVHAQTAGHDLIFDTVPSSRPRPTAASASSCPTSGPWACRASTVSSSATPTATTPAGPPACSRGWLWTGSPARCRMPTRCARPRSNTDAARRASPGRGTACASNCCTRRRPTTPPRPRKATS